MKVIELTQGFTTMVDDADYPLVMQHSWFVMFSSGKPYAACTINGKHVYLHAFLLGQKEGYVIDHIQRDSSLDNRRENLRHATWSQQNQNRMLQNNKQGKYKGVYKGSPNRWVAQIRYKGINRHLGSFKSEEEAARAYDAAAVKLHGSSAWQNFPLEMP